MKMKTLKTTLCLVAIATLNISCKHKNVGNNDDTNTNGTSLAQKSSSDNVNRNDVNADGTNASAFANGMNSN